jgi:hypothetical protein
MYKTQHVSVQALLFILRCSYCLLPWILIVGPNTDWGSNQEFEKKHTSRPSFYLSLFSHLSECKLFWRKETKHDHVKGYREYNTKSDKTSVASKLSSTLDLEGLLYSIIWIFFYIIIFVTYDLIWIGKKSDVI